jgi:hypothetical protein
MGPAVHRERNSAHGGSVAAFGTHAKPGWPTLSAPATAAPAVQRSTFSVVRSVRLPTSAPALCTELRRASRRTTHGPAKAGHYVLIENALVARSSTQQ